MSLLKLWFLERPYRHVQRYRDILAVLFRYGFADLVESLGIENYIDVGFKAIAFNRKEKLENYSRAERFRMALEELGPTFIKFGQILSTRSDLLPKDFIFELEKLQDDVRPFPFAQVKEIVERELESSISDNFLEFEETALASASLGQVHRARLKDGLQVAVKVQRPEIQLTVETDMEIMLHIATLMEDHVDFLARYGPVRIVNEMTYTLEKELDYQVEAAHINRFGQLLKNEPIVYIPRVHSALTTEKVLTMEYISGKSASDPESWDLNQENKKQLADNLFELIMKQVFEFGFFHADLHPGNIFFLEKNVICFLDFGMMGRIDRKTREDFADLVMAVSSRDEVAASQSLIRLTHTDPEDDEPDPITLQRDAADFMDRHIYRPLKEVDMGLLLQDIMGMISRYKLRFSPSLYTMLRSISAVETLSKTLNPDFDVVSQAAPYVQKVQLQRISPKRIYGELFKSGMDFIQLLKDIPGETRELLTEARRGKLKLEFKHQNLDSLVNTYDRSSKRISFAVVLASLIVGSALMVLADVPPKFYEIPIIGLLGFLLAGVMGFWLLIVIIRRGGM